MPIMRPLQTASGVPTRQRAFTLIEVLVVVAIIALLVAILLPSLAKARRQAKQVVCASNLHQAGVGLIAYGMQNKDRLPPTWCTQANNKEVPNLAGWYDTNGPYGGSYVPALTKYAGSQVWACPANKMSPPGLARPIEEDAWNYTKGSDQKYGGTHYYLAWGVGMVDVAWLKQGRYNERQQPWAATRTSEKGHRKWLIGDLVFTPEDPNKHASNHLGKARTPSGMISNAEGGNFFFLDGHAEWFGLHRLTTIMTTRYDAGEFVALPPFSTNNSTP
jgi:prepilin-type N-terminal cleavage/methylation domain-containing protein/prepilin-type processing-associated H-X9-DG protein